MAKGPNYRSGGQYRKTLQERFAEAEAEKASPPEPVTREERVVEALAGSLPVDLILADAEPPPVIPLDEDPGWMVAGMPPARKMAFFSGIGTLFAGDADGTSIYVLNRWSRSMDGARYCLHDGQPLRAKRRGRAEAIVSRCLITTQRGVDRLAVEHCNHDLEEAVRRALSGQLQEWGLEHAYQDAARAR